MKILIFAALLLSASSPSNPDPDITPGALNSEVTQANIRQTICASGFTKTVRPPASFTNKLKQKQFLEYGISNGDPRAYEEDHRVPLEIGGNPTDPRNLWPEPWPEARKKDRLETAVKRDVCAGALTLAQGRSIFLGDFWVEYRRRFGKF